MALSLATKHALILASIHSWQLTKALYWLYWKHDHISPILLFKFSLLT
jgi:hypothetical protein